MRHAPHVVNGRPAAGHPGVALQVAHNGLADFEVGGVARGLVEKVGALSEFGPQGGLRPVDVVVLEDERCL